MAFLLIHGVNNTPNAWNGVRGLLEAQGHDCHVVFLPALDSVDSIARAILEELASGSYQVVGHSFGGMVALALARIAPERVAGIALVNSSITADSEAATAARVERIAKVEQGGYEQVAQAASARAYHPENQKRDDLIQAREADVAEYGAERYVAHQKAMASRPGCQELLAQLSIPKLAVIAEGDVVIPAETQEAVSRACGMQIEKISTAGHMLPMEQPEALAKVLLAWM
jgi:pimeloyl-ACP methyl ester carboxylesterase